MKTLKYFGMMLLTAIMAFGIAACGSDSDDEGGGGSGATGWEGDWLITASLGGYPASIQVLTLDRETGRFYSTYYMTEDGEFYGGSIAYGSLTVNEKNSTMTMNGVTIEYEVEGNKIIFYGGSTSTTYYRLNSEQKAIFKEWAEKAKGHVFPYEIEPGSGGVIPGGGGSGGGGGSATGGDIIGSWYEEYNDAGFKGYDIFTFKNDGTMENVDVFTADGTTWYKDIYDICIYKTSGTKLTLTGSDGTSETYTYSVNGNTLTIGNIKFKKMTSDIQKIWNSAKDYKDYY